MSPEPFETLTEAIDYMQNGRRAAHEKSCPGGEFPCAACLSLRAAMTALDIIRAGNASPSTCKPARLALHDLVCVSGCSGDHRDDHARRQDGRVRALRSYVRDTT